MKLLSLNLGQPGTVTWREREVLTAIFKHPVTGPVRARYLGFEGDGVADPEVHGGEHKAVYAFPFEHYAHFAELLGRDDFVMGQFGENLTLEGLLETEARIGDRLRIGTAVFEITQPREPCFKLGLRMNDERILRMLLESRLTGFYLRVIEEGDVTTGQEIGLERAAGDSVSVSDITRVGYFDKDDMPVIARAVALEHLTPSWRERFQQRLEALTNIKAEPADGEATSAR